MPRFVALLALLFSATAQFGFATDVRLAFELPGMDGIIEGIAYRPSTGDCFFGDVHNRCVWRRSHDGKLARFSTLDANLLGVFNVAIDEKRHLLWAATSMVPEARGYAATDKGRAALVGLDLETGAVAELDPLTADDRDHVLGDLTVSSAGEVILTDSVSPVIWKRTRANAPLGTVVESPRFRSLQGLTLTSDDRMLIVTDYAHGFFAVDLADKTVRGIPAPQGAQLRGLDGIVRSGADVYAVQNGREPNTVVRVTFAPDVSSIVRIETVTSDAADLRDLTLITRARTGWWLVSGSG